MTSAAIGTGSRGYPNFMMIRLLAAISVIFSHSFLIAEDSEVNEPFVRFLGEGQILGIFGVFIFFFASGFLITQSALNSRSARDYGWKRVLRIYPGLIACAGACAFLLGPVFTSLPVATFFGELLPFKYVVKTALYPHPGGWQLDSVVFYDSARHIGKGMNGSLWTIPQELICYLVVGLLMVAGLLRWWVFLALALLSIPLMVMRLDAWTPVVANFAYGFPSFAFGALVFFLHRARGLDGRIALACLTLAAIAAMFGKLIDVFPMLGAYPLLWLATTDRVRLPPLKRLGDISYGTYLYGWPVEQAVRAALGDSATWWAVFGLSLPVAALLGWLSWHLIEKHALALKRAPAWGAGLLRGRKAAETG